MAENELGKKLIRYMQSKNYRIRELNIVYLEDVNADTWNPVEGRLDDWDDARIIIRNTGEVLLSCEATTEPGNVYTYQPLNYRGAFRIAFGQYKDAWEIGDHKGQLALIQCGEIRGHRDFDENGIRTGDPIVSGDNFGVNQHTTGKRNGSAPKKIGPWSAGCLVGRYSTTHYEKFMKLCQSMGHDTFDTAVIAGDEFATWKG